jgi:hypothetical protein
MQKDLVKSTSLFCDAAPPVTGLTTVVHDGDDKNVIGKNLKNNRKTEFPD